MLRRPVRFFFSGYFVSAMIILLEVIAAFWIIVELSAYSVYILIFALLTCVISAIIVINANYNPEYKVTWLVIIFFLPVFGTLLFVLFRRKKMSRKHAKMSKKILAALEELDRFEVSENLIRESSHRAAGKAHAIIGDSPTSALYQGTSSRFYGNAEDMYADMLEDLRSAKNYIFLEYFIIEGGVMWDGILDILKEKAASGVEVRVMYDDVGSMSTLPRGFNRRLHSFGIRSMCFGKVSPRISSAHNNRDHRKFLIVDGKIGYTGGINIADEYINEINRFGHWKDGGIRLSGDAVNGFVKMFLWMWDLTAGRIGEYDKYFAKSEDTGADREGDGGFYLPYGSGPTPIYRRHVGERAFLDLINQAEKYVYITTPYLIIDYDITDALRGAALRGVDVRIITPSSADKKLVKLLTKSAYPYLMEAGVKIYEYAPGFIHEKTVVSDDRYAIIGTINFDYRSLIHHYEDAVWIYNSPTIADIREEYDRTLAQSTRMTRVRARLTVKEFFARCVIRLFAPLL